MAPRSRAAALRGRIEGGRRQRPTVRPVGEQGHHDVPNIFVDLLHESTGDGSAPVDLSHRPLKRRRTSRKPTDDTLHSEALHIEAEEDRTAESFSSESNAEDHVEAINSKKNKEHIGDAALDTASCSSSEDDVEWEEVRAPLDRNDDSASEKDGNSQDEFSIVLDGPGPESVSRSNVKKPDLLFDKALRIAVNKVHVLCLLAHVYTRNSWCNDSVAQASLKKLATARMMNYVTTDAAATQYEQSRRFLEGLSDASAIWNTNFTLTAEGMRRPTWATDTESLKEFNQDIFKEFIPDRAEFRAAAKTARGSQDLGAQLFCAFLRSCGVETRLVCSIQALCFSSGHAGQRTYPAKPKIFYDRTCVESSTSDTAYHSSTSSTKAPLGDEAEGIRRIGYSKKRSEQRLSTARKQSRQNRIVQPSQYPVFWVESFNHAYQKWIPIDTFSTSTINQAHKLEPPQNQTQNTMIYVIAFDEDGYAKDVTRRYTRAYNAKTRKLRIEHTEGGDRWWRKSMGVYRRQHTLDRDQVEAAEFSRKDALEGLPKNLQDFKGHPYYVLERHLKRNEVIQPKKAVGRLNVSATASKIESVYPRKAVHVVRTADRWYRLGRQVKEGEQPLKYSAGGGRRDLSMNSDNEEIMDEENDGKALYAYFQTEIYTPPPVVRGRVPRNMFGNLDVYVPSMVPAGAVHIQVKEAAQAAKVLGVDYVDAVTGFQFRGKKGSAVIDGIVVATMFEEAVRTTIEGMEYSKELEETSQRDQELLRMWKRFHTGLKIVAHVKRYRKDGEESSSDAYDSEVESDTSMADIADQEGGGFVSSDGGFLVAPHNVRDEGHYPAANSNAAFSGVGFLIDDGWPKSSDKGDRDDGGHLTRMSKDQAELVYRDQQSSITSTTPDSQHLTQIRLQEPNIDLPVVIKVAHTGRNQASYTASPLILAKVNSQDSETSDDGQKWAIPPQENEADNGHISAELQTAELQTAELQTAEDTERKLDNNLSNIPKNDEQTENGFRKVSTLDSNVRTSENFSIHEMTAEDTAMTTQPSCEHQSDKFVRVEDESALLHDDSDELQSLMSHDPEDDDADPEWLAMG